MRVLRTATLIGTLVVSAGVYAGCGGDSESGGDGGSSGTAGSGGTAANAGVGGDDGGAGVSGSAGTGGSSGGASLGTCSDPPPAGAPQAADPPAYEGTCPDLVAGANSIQSGGATRAFLLALPSNPGPNETFPVVFLWHWLGGDATDFLEKGDVQAAVDAQRFIAVLPEKKGDLLFTWAGDIASSQARFDEELGFFDDMLACVAQKFSINKNCVSTAGVSAGAIWSGQLAGHRAEYLSSFISLSGGVGGVFRPWGNPEHKLPGIVLWGGPTDTCQGFLSFETASKALEDELEADGHFFLECIHNCGHAEPPFESTGGASKYHGLWQFALEHPFWLPPGASPYIQSGVPATVPSWCGIGKGSSTPREGTCENASAC